MKTLSVMQPWAWLLAHGHKDIENRTWPTKVRGWVLVHAGKAMDLSAWPTVGEQMPQIKLPLLLEIDRGAVVGAVRIDDCVTTSKSPWFGGPYGFVIGKAFALDRPVPARGMLGFFECWTDELRGLPAEIREGMA